LHSSSYCRLVQVIFNKQKTKSWNKIAQFSKNSFSHWGTLKYGVHQISILGPLLLLIYINNLPKRINSLLELILFANDTSTLITTRNFEDFFSVSNLVLSCMIEWFKANKLVLTLEKTNIIKPETLNSSVYALATGYKDKYTEETVHTHFLVLQPNSHLIWKNHIDQMIPK